MSHQLGIQQLSVISLATAICAAATLSICPDTHAQIRMLRRGGDRFSQPNPASQPATVSIDSVSDIQSTPTRTTNVTITEANSSGGGAARINTRATQVTTPDRADAITDTSVTNGGLNANVGTKANVINTPKYVQGSGQSYGQVTGGNSMTSADTVGASTYSPNGNSARGFARGSAKGSR